MTAPLKPQRAWVIPLDRPQRLSMEGTTGYVRVIEATPTTAAAAEMRRLIERIVAHDDSQGDSGILDVESYDRTINEAHRLLIRLAAAEAERAKGGV